MTGENNHNEKEEGASHGAPLLEDALEESIAENAPELLPGELEEQLKSDEIKNYSEFLSILNKQSDNTERLEDKENQDLLDLRRKWGNWVLIFIGLIIGFDIVLVFLYGMGVWNFQEPKVVMVIVTENFLKVIGLGLLITQSVFERIFPKEPKK